MAIRGALQARQKAILDTTVGAARRPSWSWLGIAWFLAGRSNRGGSGNRNAKGGGSFHRCSADRRTAPSVAEWPRSCNTRAEPAVTSVGSFAYAASPINLVFVKRSKRRQSP
jgi:hypothetical protein